MSFFRVIVNTAQRAVKPKPGEVYHAMREDSFREYVTTDITPARLAGIFRDFDAGDFSRAAALFDEMEEKDEHLCAVANVRRMALTRMPIAVQPATEVLRINDADLKAKADEAAQFVRERLAYVYEFRSVLRHLAEAVGRNIAAAEIVWDTAPGGKLLLAGLKPVEASRFTYMSPDGEPARMRAITAENRWPGIEIPPDKFIVHTPNSAAGLPTKRTLFRASALVWFIKYFTIRQWAIYGERFGNPIRWAKYRSGASAAEKAELKTMLQSIGTDAWAMFSEAVDLEFLEAKRDRSSASPHEKLCTFCNAGLSKVWLGQTMTVENKEGVGSNAMAEVHNDVRADLRDDDAEKESETIRKQLFWPMVKWGLGEDFPVPFLQRRPIPMRNPLTSAQVASVAVNELGMRLDVGATARALGLTLSKDPAKALPGRRLSLVSTGDISGGLRRLVTARSDTAGGERGSLIQNRGAGNT